MKTSWLIIIFLAVCGYVWISSAPINFPQGSVITVSQGATLTTIANTFKAKHAVVSALLFRSTIILLGGEKRVIAGDYLLDSHDTVFALARRLVTGDFHLALVKATIPEGWSAAQIGAYLRSRLAQFDENHFLALAKPLEGYLFPDTYFLSPVATPETVIGTMRSNFDAAVDISAIRQSAKPLKDIVIMASLVEAEARTAADRRIVSSILWKRIALDMPLQVDSTFLYINGKNTYELTDKDLKINSPYNTYVHTGLPPTPINNPGIDSLIAAANPQSTDYLYFFSGKDGVMHYATTLAGHQKNIETYGK